MAETDYWAECFDPGMNVSPKDFERTFCRVCLNPECVRSAAAGLHWVQRMATQADRLLVNPIFASPKDPRFAEIRAIPFLNFHEPIVVPGRPPEWHDTAVVPPPVVMPAAPTPPSQPKPTGGDPPTRVLREAEMQGSGNDLYRVTLEQQGDAAPQWVCTCRAYTYGTARPCKHIIYIASRPEEEPEEEPIPSTPPKGAPPPRFQQPVPEPSKTLPRGFIQPPQAPRLANIPVPSEGLMVDGSKPPPRGSASVAKPDPWAAPSRPNNIIPVGGKVVLGKK